MRSSHYPRARANSDLQVIRHFYLQILTLRYTARAYVPALWWLFTPKQGQKGRKVSSVFGFLTFSNNLISQTKRHLILPVKWKHAYYLSNCGSACFCQVWKYIIRLMYSEAEFSYVKTAAKHKKK